MRQEADDRPSGCRDPQLCYRRRASATTSARRELGAAARRHDLRERPSSGELKPRRSARDIHPLALFAERRGGSSSEVFATTFRRRRARARVRSCQNAIERWSQLYTAAAGEVSAPSSSCTAPATSSSAPWVQAATRSHHESREGRQMLLRPDEWRRAECWDRAGSAAVRLVSRAVQRTRMVKDGHSSCTVLNAGCAAGCPR